ncbi:D-alanyl-D-alanine carboxypeptidase [Persicobacter psychrovividus]|uniref:D-alanyl-D-alanine carboxypeptidase n=1 Tax=Persicobacter psychrovividus TaxID=387638 RepID=A0ABN6L790_9BACT|nr:D-alanyl-D-alanine carboxypeptidase [Persicobacter psychrovividus]
MINQHFKILFPTALILLACCFGCKKQAVKTALPETPLQHFAENHWTGFILTDPQTGHVLDSLNADQWFTPASNTKLFTFFTADSLLNDRAPLFRYHWQGDSLVVQPTGNPTLFHPDFEDTLLRQFLLLAPKEIYVAPRTFEDQPWGAGWTWDDFHLSYCPERSVMPVHGNVVNYQWDPFTLKPHSSTNFFNQVPKWRNSGKCIERDIKTNQVYYHPEACPMTGKTVSVPFATDQLTVNIPLLSSLSGKTFLPLILPYQLPEGKKWDVLETLPMDSLYKKMLQESDNFFAEQIMLMASGELSDTLSTKKVIQWAKKNQWIHENPRWVDGSGLSRYNQFTPRQFVKLLNRLYQEGKFDRMKEILPHNGGHGTLKYLLENDAPFIYAKSGSMSGIYCLSGYVVCKSGRVLSFSWLNNNIHGSYHPVRKAMFEKLKEVAENY